MNKFKILSTVILFVLILSSIISCKKVLDVNSDPNVPKTARPDLLLPNIELTISESIGGRGVPWIFSMWNQYWTSGPGISMTNLENYAVTTADIDRTWSDLYARPLQDIEELNKYNQPVYNGIGMLLKAYVFQILVDLYGDAPFTEANKGEQNIINPKYDKAADIYAKLIPLIDEGLRNIDSVSSNPTQPFLAPTTDDIIYAGNLSKWHMFANSLKLKILMRQSTTNNAKLLEAMDLINSGVTFITDNADNAKVAYAGVQGSSQNPMFSLFSNRPTVGNYMVASKTSIDYLTSISDPRRARFYIANSSSVYKGLGQGAVNESENLNIPRQAFSRPNTSYIYKSNAPVLFLTSWETYFFMAEAKLRTAEGTDQNDYENAVKASFSYLSLSNSNIILSDTTRAGYSGSDNNKLRLIAIQKWIAFNGLQNIESWSEIRRFDTPTQTIFRGTGGLFSSPPSNSLGIGVFPSLLPYGSSEISYNSNCPGQHSITTKVFWDN